MPGKFYIRIQQRQALPEGKDPRDWRNYRKFSVWPILFETYAEAKEFLDQNFTFKNIHGRKLSASVCSGRVRPRFR